MTEDLLQISYVEDAMESNLTLTRAVIFGKNMHQVETNKIDSWQRRILDVAKTKRADTWRGTSNRTGKEKIPREGATLIHKSISAYTSCCVQTSYIRKTLVLIVVYSWNSFGKFRGTS